MKNALVLSTISLVLALVGCDKAQEKPAAKEEAKPAAATPVAAAEKAAHGGEVVTLGTAKLGAFEVRASRDKGEIKPGGDAPIDLWIDGGVGKGVTVVRLWIGAEDAKGSMKAKADIEDGKWHAHVEVPSPTPAGSKLWVEIEEAADKKSVTSLDLKP